MILSLNSWLLHLVLYLHDLQHNQHTPKSVKRGKEKLTSIFLPSLFSCISFKLPSMRLLRWRYQQSDIYNIGMSNWWTYISFSMYSNRPSTVLFASVVSCFSSTGPTSLYMLASSARLPNSYYRVSSPGWRARPQVANLLHALVFLLLAFELLPS